MAHAYRTHTHPQAWNLKPDLSCSSSLYLTSLRSSEDTEGSNTTDSEPDHIDEGGSLPEQDLDHNPKDGSDDQLADEEPTVISLGVLGMLQGRD
jgi:hypothetical protein